MGEKWYDVWVHVWWLTFTSLPLLADVWELDFRDSCLYRVGVHCYSQGVWEHHVNEHVTYMIDCTGNSVCATANPEGEGIDSIDWLSGYYIWSVCFSLPWTHITGHGSITLSSGGHCFSTLFSLCSGEASFGIIHFISIEILFCITFPLGK